MAFMWLGTCATMDALRKSQDKLLRTADLVAWEDFRLGEAVVSPASRTVKGPGGSTAVEPRIMQVLVVLAQSTGRVVTRNTLFECCWGGVFVGDDSLNRAIGEVRKLASAVGGGSFILETVPRTGYQLKVLRGSAPRAVGDADPAALALSRRRMIAGGAGALFTLGGIGIWSAVRVRQIARFDELMKAADAAVRNGSAFANDDMTQLVEQAILIRPESASAWGLLALIRSQRAKAQSAGALSRIRAAETAARTALAIDPREPNALLAMIGLQGSALDWTTRDRKLRQVLAIDPQNITAIGELVLLLQAAGLNRESWNWNERALAIEPLSIEGLCKRALKLWIAGRVSAADKVIDQARGLAPSNPWPWWVRFLILALSERPFAAGAMLEANPEMLGPDTTRRFWQACLTALDRRSAETIARAREACRHGAMHSGELAGQGVMILSALGEVDSAFDVTDGFLLSRGSIVRRDDAGSKLALSDSELRINTQWLFTPPAAVMRADPRFLPLCDAFGLADYWRERGVRPDYLLN